ncbi:MAG: outer membrane lipoprotein-sorting protein [Candidatus Omnitrophota bacterium]
MTKIVKVLFFLMAWGISYAHALSGEEAIRDVETKYSAITSYKVMYRLEVNSQEQSFTSEGAVFFKTPDKVKMESVVMLNGPAKQTIISNGSLMWVYIPGTSGVSKINLDALRRHFGNNYFDYQEPNVCKPFKEVDRDSLKFLGVEQYEGKDVYVFEAAPSKNQIAQGLSPAAKVTLWISTDTGLEHKTSITDESGNEIMRHIFKDFVINTPINDYEFEFKPSKDVQISDITNDIQAKMKEIVAGR